MIYKQEAIDVLEAFRRNTAHVLGEDDTQVKTIDTCMRLISELEDAGWTPVAEAVPPFTSTSDGISYSDDVLGVDTEGHTVICTYDSFGHWYDDYGDYRDIVKWCELPNG